MTTDPTAAVTERDGTGDVAEIAADSRDLLRVGVVDVIWRWLLT